MKKQIKGFTFLFIYMVVAFQSQFVLSQSAKQITQLTNDSILVEYPRYRLWINCASRSAYMFEYMVGEDKGNIPRYNDFNHDAKIPKRCQQTSAAGYSYGYDRGHLVPQNHLDDDFLSMVSSNYMVNILPQKATLNRGAWLLTEEMIECHRDANKIRVLGGAFWKDDSFKFHKHNVKAPSEFWKVMVKDNGEAIAFIFPNSNETKGKNVDDFIVSIEQIESRIGFNIVGDRSLANTKPKTAWTIPKYCKKG